MKKLIILSILLVGLLCIPVFAAPITIYVDDDAPNDPCHGNPDYSDPLEDGSMQHPFDTIQEGINVAFDGDTVIVAPGTYTGNGNRDIDFNGKALTVRSIDPNDPNVVAATIIDCNGTESEPHRGFYFYSGEDENSVLNGLKITNGYGPDQGSHSRGGAICCISASPTIRNCTFSDNSAYWEGGGMYNQSSSPILTNCTFSWNTLVGMGGGMCNQSSSPKLTNCTFSGNLANSRGGGMINYSSSPMVTNCTFNENQAHDMGGGMFNQGSNSLTLTNCTFSMNHAGSGGAMLNSGSSPMLTNCTFSDNRGDLTGGGIHNQDNSSPKFTNCTFSRNSVQRNGRGGVMYSWDSNPTLTNCTFSRNSVQTNGRGGVMYSWDSNPTLTNCTLSNNLAGEYGVVYNYDSNPTVNNCILWANTGSQIYNYGTSSPTVTYCNVQDGYDGAGNINVDPCFVNADSDDFHLRPDSLCIDVGDPNYVAGPNETDLDGNPRVIGGRIDMGAYEFVALYVDANSPNDPGTGTPDDSFRRIQDGIDASTKGYFVLVAGGQYNESLTIEDGNDIYLFGGYDGSDWTAPRDPNTNETIIDGQYGYDQPVVSVIDASTTIDGFVIQNGQGYQRRHGGGIYCASSNGTELTVRIFNNIIQNNFLSSFLKCYGAGIYCDSYVKPVIVDNVIQNNTMESTDICAGGGGGIYCAGLACKISGNVVVDNEIYSSYQYIYESSEGGGIWVGGGLISDNTVLRNLVVANYHYYDRHYVKGGGIYCNGPATLMRNGVEDNELFCRGYETETGDTSEAYGGGIFAPNCEIIQNIVKGNTCHGDGGGYVWRPTYDGADGIAHGGGVYGPNAVLIGNLITNNNAIGEGGSGGYAPYPHGDPNDTTEGGNGTARGGGIYAPGATITNNTVANNQTIASFGYGYVHTVGHDPNYDGTAILEGAGIYADNDSIITNTIVWANSPDQLSGQDCNKVIYSDIGDGNCIDSIGNISMEPSFVDPNNPDPNYCDYHLQSNSPCIDIGDPNSDYGNEPQPNGNIINMGAYGNTIEASISSLDFDSDGVANPWEIYWGLNPDSNDTDGDGLSDYYEVCYDYDCNDYNPYPTGSDLNANSADTDQDGFTDAVEIYHGSSPIDEFSLPQLMIIYVDANSPNDPGTGNINDPFGLIQDGIDAAINDDTVRVAQGRYYENINFNGNNIILTSIDPNNPSVVANTIIDGNDAGSVVTFAGTEDANCLLTGLTITNGTGTVNGSGFYGGGIYGGGTHAAIGKCLITGNGTADWSIGGGIYDCDGLVIDCNISNNTSYWSGGGLAYCDGEVKGCTVSGNVCTSGQDPWGAGLYMCDGTIKNCRIVGNNCPAREANGGGVSHCSGAIINCEIVGNFVGGWAGGMAFCDGSIIGCVISNNVAGADAGGLYYCDANIVNCIIANNINTDDWASFTNAGGLYRCNGRIINCTIVSNIVQGSDNDSGGLYDCVGEITNCIVWGNINTGDVNAAQLYACSDPNYSCIQDWTGGSFGNISVDPCFADPCNGDYHLKSYYGRWDPNTHTWIQDNVTSPCIDAGEPNDPNWMNELWPHGKRINMGAYGGTPEASMSASEYGNIADLNHDGMVNFADFTLFCNSWPLEQVLLAGDLDRNGVVDYNDLAIFIEQWLEVEPFKFYEFNLDVDPGWTMQGEWQFGQPTGGGGAYGNPDPNSGYTGNSVYGVNLNGDYDTAVGGPYYLTAGPFDCNGFYNVCLKFARWLNTDTPAYIISKIEASNNGTDWDVIWEHTGSSDITDSSWQIVEYDISSTADNYETVYIRWSYEVLDSHVFPYSGWNIDDIQLWGTVY